MRHIQGNYIMWQQLDDANDDNAFQCVCVNGTKTYDDTTGLSLILAPIGNEMCFRQAMICTHASFTANPNGPLLGIRPSCQQWLVQPRFRKLLIRQMPNSAEAVGDASTRRATSQLTDTPTSKPSTCSARCAIEWVTRVLPASAHAPRRSCRRRDITVGHFRPLTRRCKLRTISPEVQFSQYRRTSFSRCYAHSSCSGACR